MKATRSGIVIGLALALLVPGSVIGQEDTSGVAVADPPDVTEPVTLTVEWGDSISLPKGGAGTLLDDAAALPSGDIALLGNENVGGPTTAWHSPDGLTWTAATPPSPAIATYPAVVATSAGFVAASGYPSGMSTAWRSANGKKWSKPTIVQPAWLQAVAPSGDTGVVAGGATFRKDGKWVPSVWRSTDGKKWGKPITVGDAASQFDISAVAVSPNGIHLVAGMQDPWTKKQQARFWRSADGKSFDEISPPSGEVADAVWAGAGFVLATTDGEVVTLWLSEDGAEWAALASVPGTRATLKTGPGGVAATIPAIGDDKKTADAAASDTAPAILVSADGQTWCSTSGPRPSQGGFGEFALPLGDGRLLAAGFAAAKKDDVFQSKPLVWVGQLSGPEGASDCLVEPVPSDQDVTESK